MTRASRALAWALALAPAAASAQPAPETAATRPLEATSAQPAAPEEPRGVVLTSGRASLTLSGQAEAFWQWNFNNPGNGLTAWRGFDNRHNAFTLANVVLDAAWRYGPVFGRVALQVGHTPESYYAAEPSRAASTTAGVGATGADVWKYLQQANVGFRAGDFTVEAGLFLSPIGPESMAVRDNWNWSRSNLFFGLPFYHTGLRAAWAPDGPHALSLAVFNGWNSVVDNNAAKSVVLQYTFTPSADAALSALYFGGIERDDAHPAGPSWRHMLDLHGRLRVARRVSLMGHLNVGLEPNRIGTNVWFAAALYARVSLSRRVHLAARADYFLDDAPTAQARIFWPVAWMASQTATLELTPFDHVSVRLEYRHDLAEAAAFFEGATLVSGGVGAVPNTRSQDTLTAGMVAWF